MLIASFDIGEKNFAYCVARSEGPPEETPIEIVKVAHHNVILKKRQTVIESCVQVSQLMAADATLMACELFIIEQQMRCNTRAQRLAQHVWSTLYSKFPNNHVGFVPSHMKTQHFLGKNKLKDKERKTWAVDKVTQDVLQGERHVNIVKEILQMPKKDDVCDTILQVIAYVEKGLYKKNE